MRHGDLMAMNCAGPKGAGNTYGKVVYIDVKTTTRIGPNGEIIFQPQTSAADLPAGKTAPLTDSEYQEILQEQQRVEGEIAAVKEGIAWEATQAGIDAASLIDPPSDPIAAGMSFAADGFRDADSSIVSAVPYFGDARAKPIKATRAAQKATKLADKLKKLKHKSARLAARLRGFKAGEKPRPGTGTAGGGRGSRWPDGGNIPGRTKRIPGDSPIEECPDSVKLSHVTSDPACALARPTTEMPAVIASQRTEWFKAIISPKVRFRSVTFRSTNPSVAALQPDKPDSDTQLLEVETRAQGDTELQAVCKGKVLSTFPLRVARFELPLLIAQSKRRPGLNADGTQAADMKYGDYTEQQIKDISWKFGGFLSGDMSGMTADVHFAYFREMATVPFSMVSGSLRQNIESMIDHFQASSGTDYSNPVLTEAVRNHASTQRFFDQIHRQLQQHLAKSKGDINALLTSNKIDLDGRPHFNGTADTLSGLTIAINDTWAYEVYIDDYSLTGGCWAGEFRVVLWDHFGLDEPDVDESKNYNWLAGFRSWFILQHLDRFAYRPFRTKIVLGGNRFQGRIQCH